MIRAYDQNTEDKIFLSPYVNIEYNDTKTVVILRSRIFSDSVILPVSSAEELDGLLNALSSVGLSIKELENALCKIYPELKDPSQAVELLIKAGILE